MCSKKDAMARRFSVLVFAAVVVAFASLLAVNIPIVAAQEQCRVEHCKACLSGSAVVCETCDDGYTATDYGVTCTESTEVKEPDYTEGTTTTASPLTQCYVDNCLSCDSLVRTKCARCLDGFRLSNSGSLCARISTKAPAFITQGVTARPATGVAGGILAVLTVAIAFVASSF